LTDRVLYFPCISSLPQAVDLDYHIYENSDWLLFPIEPPLMEYRFMEGVLKIQNHPNVKDALKLSRKHKSDIEDRILSLMYSQNYIGGRR